MNLKKNTLDATHLKFLDKMYKYEIDPASIVEDTEQTLFCPHTDGRTDGQTVKVKPVYPLQVRGGGGGGVIDWPGTRVVLWVRATTLHHG